MIVRLKPLAWVDMRPTWSTTGQTVIGYGSVDWFESQEREVFDRGERAWRHLPAGWYYECSWDHGSEELGSPTPCDSLEHGKQLVEASYLAHLKPAFDFVETA